MDTVAVTALRAGALTGLTADAGARTITGRLAVYDLAGHTSAGRTVFAAGAIAAPAAERVALLVEHDRSRAVGFATAIDDRGTELWASFYLPPGDAADAALQDAASGVRNGLSVGLEIAASHRDADGVLFITASTLREGSLVSVPAFQDTRVTEVAASSPDLPPPPPPLPFPAAAPAAGTPPAVGFGDGAPNPTAAGIAAAAAPAGIPPARTSPRGPETMTDLYGMLTAASTGRGSAELTAALADITHTANSWAQPQQYAGELWGGVTYVRRIVPLIANRPLTSYKVNGWRWAPAPAVGPWQGDKTAVPSNAAATEAVTKDAERLAGAHDIDRKYRDFNDTEFFASYYAAMAESYAQQSDGAVLADMLAEATPYVAVVGESVWASIVGAALEVGKKAPSTFIVVGAAVLKALVEQPTATAPAFLSLLPNNPLGGIVTAPTMPPNDVLVGAREAATFYELPSTPIRVEAVDMTKGGIDPGVFGYYATIVNQPLALQTFTVTPPAAAAAAGHSRK